MTASGSADPQASVVIPAHDEAAVIARSIGRLRAGARPNELDLVVVANGCTDTTAVEAARAGARVLETPLPGKAAAIRLGDSACRTYPRIYLDADVDVDIESLRAMVAALATPGVLACAPVVTWDLIEVGGIAARVHNVHARLVDSRGLLSGRGVYALNQAGHDRVFPMPDVVSDDGWVNSCFGSSERAVVDKAHCLVRPARTVRAHLRRRVRVRLGNRQLAATGRSVRDAPIRLSDLKRELHAGTVSRLDAGCYLTVLVLDRAATQWRLIRGADVPWDKDHTSRTQT